MPWKATLIDGPFEGRTIFVEEEHDSDPPGSVDVDGERYLYCGFSDNTPRYRHDAAA